MPRKKVTTVTTTTEFVDETPTRTVMGVVIDRSGSMQSKTHETIAGFNSWLLLQKTTPGDAILVRTLFSDFAYVEGAIPIWAVVPLDLTTYQASGFTALYDAVAKTVLAMEAVSQPGDRFLVLIITDGAENASREYTLDAIQQMLTSRTAKGNWTFTYQGSEADSWKNASSLGVASGNYANYANTGKGTCDAFVAMSASTAGYRSSAAPSSANFYNPPTVPAPDAPAPLVVDNPTIDVVGSLENAQPLLGRRNRAKTSQIKP